MKILIEENIALLLGLVAVGSTLYLAAKIYQAQQRAKAKATILKCLIQEELMAERVRYDFLKNYNEALSRILYKKTIIKNTSDKKTHLIECDSSVQTNIINQSLFANPALKRLDNKSVACAVRNIAAYNEETETLKIALTQQLADFGVDLNDNKNNGKVENVTIRI